MKLSYSRSIGLSILLTLSVFSLLFGQGNESKDISRLFSVKPTVFRGDADLKKGVLLDLDEALLSRQVEEADFNVSMTVPLSYEENVNLKLTRFKVVADGFIVRSSSGDTLDFDPGIHYRGQIEGYEGFATISMFDNQLYGLISIKGKGDFNLGKIENQRNDDYIIYNDRDLNHEMNFECHTPDPPIENYDFDSTPDRDRRFTDCVKVYIEGDYALYQDKGSVNNAATYCTALFAEVATLYDAEDIGIEISEIMIWDSPDGYSTSDAGDALDEFEDNNPNFNGDLAQLFALGGNGLGGLAWVDVLCGWKPYAYENIGSGFNNYPNYSWSIEVVAHEMGHNFGSRHTHACVWNGNSTQIDDCGNEYNPPTSPGDEGYGCYDSNNPILPSSGTVMSYCHLLWGVGINLANGFGPQPGNLIRNRYDDAGCLTACTGGGPLAPVADFDADNTEICAGEYVQFYDLSVNTPDSWFWIFEGGLPEESTDQEPWIYYESPGVFDVELEVSNGGGTDNLYLPNYITVLDAPLSSFSYDISDYFEVSFINESINADDYYWEFGDGNTSFQENPVHVYEEDGTYTVTLYAIHDVCNDAIYSETITIVSPPEAGMLIPVDSGCFPLQVNFMDASSTNVTQWSWTFEGATPNVSTSKNPTVSYPNPGTYSVSLTVYNSLYEDMVAYNDTIVVLDVPIAGFTPNVASNTVNFDNTSTGALAYVWDFGDGNGSDEEEPTHTYENSGDYTCQLIAINECGNDTLEVEIEITAEANAAFFVQEDTICVMDTAFFNSLSNTENIQWIFESGSPAMSTDLNPQVVYNTPGTFMVTQYAYNELGGDTLEVDNYITVIGNPTAGFDSEIDGYEVAFSQTLNNANSFMWNFGDGSTGTDENPNHTYSEDGTYSVSLTAYGTCDTITSTQDVVIANPPLAAFTMDVSSGCAPISVQFTNQSSSNADSFIWTFEGGEPAESTEENPSVTFSEAGTFSVLLQATNEQGDDYALMEDVIVVSDIPTIDFSWDSELLSFSFNFEGEADEFVSWDFGDGNTSTDLNPTHTYGSEGFYEVTVYASNDCGDTEKTLTVEAAIKPEADFSYDLQSGCAPLEVQYTNQTTGNPNSIVWLFEGGDPLSSTDETPVVTYYQGGTFSTQLIAFSSNGNDTLTMDNIITVDAGPNPQFYFTMNGATVTFFNQTVGANSFIWNFGDGKASIEESPSHTYTANGTYTVTLYANNDCGQNAKEINIEISTVNTFDLIAGDIKLYPNPNGGRFDLEMDLKEQEDLEITVFDLIGKKVDAKTLSLSAGHHLLSFDYPELKQGFYILQLDNGSVSKRLKFAVQ
jgi:PKD repeat protein